MLNSRENRPLIDELTETQNHKINHVTIVKPSKPFDLESTEHRSFRGRQSYSRIHPCVCVHV